MAGVGPMTRTNVATDTDTSLSRPRETSSIAARSCSVYGWDWSATTHDGLRVARESQGLGTDPTGAVPVLVKALGAHRLIPGKGLQGWSRSLQAFDADGFALGSIYYGGGRDDVHVRSSSAAATGARRAVLAVDPEARTARVDTCVDTLVPYEELVGVCHDAAAVYGSRVTVMESFQRGESLGRTLYLGAPTSAVRVRLYEKWLESPGQWAEGTNRVEVQLRPPSRVKGRVSGWGAAETFCASRTTRALAEQLGQDLTPAQSLHVDRGTPDLERTLEAMGEQYGPAVERWLALSGGDMDTVCDRLLGRVPDSRLALV